MLRIEGFEVKPSSLPVWSRRSCWPCALGLGKRGGRINVDPWLINPAPFKGLNIRIPNHGFGLGAMVLATRV